MTFWMLHKKREPLEPVAALKREDPPDFVRVSVAGCGLCHTDLGFIYDPVPTRKELPLVLGHEISGVVEEGALAGRQVLVPAVIPCGTCAHCCAGHPRSCPHQIMPGNDIHGGFGPWLRVPERALVPIPEVVSTDQLARLAVVSDAVTTPLQALQNVSLSANHVAIVIGCGGVGSFACLLARSMGAHVLALDIADAKLEQLRSLGIEHTLNTRNLGFKDIKAWVKSICRDHQYPGFGHRILETSGTRAGQELAFGLMGAGALMAVIGFTLDKVEIRLSNLMAFDAQIMGNWGASPDIYPRAIDIALSGALHLDTMTELVPMDSINATIERVHEQGTERRIVFTP